MRTTAVTSRWPFFTHGRCDRRCCFGASSTPSELALASDAVTGGGRLLHQQQKTGIGLGLQAQERNDGLRGFVSASQSEAGRQALRDRRQEIERVSGFTENFNIPEAAAPIYCRGTPPIWWPTS